MTGQVLLIYPSMRQQFVVEGVLAALLILACSLSFVALQAAGPTRSGVIQRSWIYGSIAVFTFCFLVLVRIFAAKTPGYLHYAW